MNRFLKDHPDLFRKENDFYRCYTQDGALTCLVAGQDNVTEEWIRFVKEMDKDTFNEMRRHIRVRWNGEEFAATVVSYDTLDSELAERAFKLISDDQSGEAQVIRQEEKREFYARFNNVWKSLSEKQKRTFIDYRFHGMTQQQLADREGVDRISIRERVKRIENRFRKVFQ